MSDYARSLAARSAGLPAAGVVPLLPRPLTRFEPGAANQEPGMLADDAFVDAATPLRPAAPFEPQRSLSRASAPEASFEPEAQSRQATVSNHGDSLPETTAVAQRPPMTASQVLAPVERAGGDTHGDWPSADTSESAPLAPVQRIADGLDPGVAARPEPGKVELAPPVHAFISEQATPGPAQPAHPLEPTIAISIGAVSVEIIQPPAPRASAPAPARPAREGTRGFAAYARARTGNLR